MVAIRTLRDGDEDEYEDAEGGPTDDAPASSTPASGTGAPRSLRVSYDARSTRSAIGSSGRATRSPRHSRVDRTIVMTDIVGSAAMWRDAPTQMMDMLDRLVPVVLSSAAEHGGQVIKMIGDAFMLVFDSHATAVQFVARLQTGVVPDLSSPDLPLRMRVGVAHGPLHLRKMVMQECEMVDYFGPTVNIAARAESGVSPVGGFAITLHHGVTLDTVRDALHAAGVANPHLRRVRWSDGDGDVDSASASNSNAPAPIVMTRRGTVQTQVRSAAMLKGVRPVPMLRVCFDEDKTCLDSASITNRASRRADALPQGPAALTADRSAATALRTAHVRFAKDGGGSTKGRPQSTRSRRRT